MPVNMRMMAILGPGERAAYEGAKVIFVHEPSEAEARRQFARTLANGREAEGAVEGGEVIYGGGGAIVRRNVGQVLGLR